MPDLIRDRAATQYQLDPDAWEGFSKAVHNGQTRLALEYLLNYLGEEREAAKAMEPAPAGPAVVDEPVAEVVPVEAHTTPKPSKAPASAKA